MIRVYKITIDPTPTVPNSGAYIGSTVSTLAQRLAQHKTQACVIDENLNYKYRSRFYECLRSHILPDRKAETPNIRITALIEEAIQEGTTADAISYRMRHLEQIELEREKAAGTALLNTLKASVGGSPEDRKKYYNAYHREYQKTKYAEYMKKYMTEYKPTEEQKRKYINTLLEKSRKKTEEKQAQILADMEREYIEIADEKEIKINDVKTKLTVEMVRAGNYGATIKERLSLMRQANRK